MNKTEQFKTVIETLDQLKLLEGILLEMGRLDIMARTMDCHRSLRKVAIEIGKEALNE